MVQIACAPGGLGMEPLSSSVIKTYYILRLLGFIEVDGKVIYLDTEKIKL
jgi:hypothetical protein